MSEVKKVVQHDIVREGKQIVLPEGMGYTTAIDNIKRRMEYEEQVISIIEDIDTFVWDGALALQSAIKEMFGWSEATPTKSMFGTNPPKMIQVETGVDEYTLVPWGSFKLVGIEGTLMTCTTMKKGRLIFQFRADVKRKDEDTIKALAELARKYVRERSIYRGKAIKISFFDEDGRRMDMPTPTFIDALAVVESDIVFAEDVQSAVDGNILTPILHSDMCRKNRIPLKRGVLLSGTYGTGKTLVANLTAKKCVQNGWTFIMCDKAMEIKDVVEFAHQYQPAVVFCEDIDRVVDGDRDADMDNILNIIDGIESKHTELMVVLTTNQVERIHPAMLRPGRLDAVINVLPPDKEAVERLIRIYGRGLVPKDEDLTEAGAVLAGRIPAVIRECVERAKLYAIARNDGNKLVIHGEDVVASAKSMSHQLELLYPQAKEMNELERTGHLARELFGRALPEHLNGGFKEKMELVFDTLKRVKDSMDND